MHCKALPMVSKAVSGLPEIYATHEGICKGCAQGNNAKNKFPSSERKDKGILEIVHSHVCRLMSSSPLSRYVYYVSFIDDFSRKTWIYFLKWKSELFNKFKEYKPWLRTILIGRSRFYDQIMVESSHQMNSRNSAKSLQLRGST